MGSGFRTKSWYAASLLWAACASEPTLVASNCDQSGGCVKQEALRIDAVDILLVIDDSPSIAHKTAQLKAELPRMLTAITTGEDGTASFPPARSVHVAVTTADMGGAPDEPHPVCVGGGQDGVFVRPGDVGVTCDVSYPGYLAYEGGPAALSAVESVGCVPLVFADTKAGCGFEQPLEAALKALWPSGDDSVTFNTGSGHGGLQNAGFLRENSLLVVIVVSDEDDCSAADPEILALTRGDYRQQAPNLRCYLNPEKLQQPQRYVDHLKRLRPHNDNVIFAVIGGVPADLVSDERRAAYDFNDPAQADRYFAEVLAARDMQERAENEQEAIGRLLPSCATDIDGTLHAATPPRRLVEVARGFGSQGVLGSICTPDFGATTGHIIRALGEKLSATGAN